MLPERNATVNCCEDTHWINNSIPLVIGSEIRGWRHQFEFGKREREALTGPLLSVQYKKHMVHASSIQ